ncbi:tyrosine-type recombinase/integrase [Patescibacteria group bacterium]|nr:tyrosine-type recombinase/integrase [Patescibacteria group bacterium]
MQSRELDIKQAIEIFSNYLAGKNAPQTTIRAYTDDLKQFAKWLAGETGEQRVQRIDKLDVEGYLSYLGRQKLTGITRRRKLQSLRKFFNCMIDLEYLDKNSAAKVSPPNSEKRNPTILYQHEYKALLYEARNNPRDLAILQTFLQTGIRVGELCSLTLEDIDLEAKELIVKQGKGAVDRSIPLTEKAVEALKAYLDTRPQKEPRAVFLSKHQTPLDVRSVNYMVKKYVKKAGIKKPISVHTLRHTCATHKADKGMSLTDLQAILGHRRLETTYKYLHLAKTSLRDQMEATAL